MKLDEIVAWYQKKIGTYDKQQWEKTVEQKILDGFSCFPLKNGKVKTEFIDVDLVRGSTFPKAKAKEPLFSVIRLALLRYIFLPIYAKWWVAQTSPNIFAFLLFLYSSEMLNWAIYSFNTHRSGDDIEHIVSVSELLIPMILSFALSLIHSQIVATNNGNNIGGQNPKHTNSVQKPRERTRRRKKLVKVRQEQDTHPKTNSRKNFSDACNISDTKKPTTLNFQTNINLKNNLKTPYPSDSNLKDESECANFFLSNCTSHNKKRNVNWDSPVYNYASEFIMQSKESCECSNSNVLSKGEIKEHLIDKADCLNTGLNDVTQDTADTNKNHPIDDDGFESLNGKSSSGEEALLSVNNILGNTNNCTLRHRTSALSSVQNQKNSIEVVLSNQLGMDVKRTNSDVCDNKQDDAYKYRKLKSDASSKDVEQSTDEENDDGEISTPQPKDSSYLDGTTSTTEWLGITTNSEECSYSSEFENSDNQQQSSYDEDFTPSVILNPYGSLDRISCTVWHRQDVKKAEMSVLDISSCIIERVEAMPESCDYIYIGLLFSIILSLLPLFCRLCEATVDSENSTEINYLHLPQLLLEKASFSFLTILVFAFGESKWETTVLIIGFIQRLFLTFIVFFLLAVAEKTFKQRFLYAKLFSHLTSSRRARKSDLPHFRLNKVRNIKTWLSVRSYLKRRGPQRSVDVIVSAAFIVTLLLLSFLSLEWLKDSVHLHSQINLEALLWSSSLGIYLLRFMTLGNKINRKYRSISVLITEQINLYLQIEQKPKKKDELMVSNSVLKLAADLLKELESPFKISGLSANPYLYTTIKVVILSALSGVLSEMLGFKLKLHKIKIK